MFLLAIDTSSPAFSCALLEDGAERAALHVRGRMAAEVDQLLTLDRMLQSAGVAIAEVDAFACTIGPGSFTGLRVGLSLLKGLALPGARPVFGISTLEALAAAVGYPPGPVVACLDARRHEVYAAAWSDGGVVVPEGVYAVEALRERVRGLGGEPLWVGGGARVCGEALGLAPGRLAPEWFDAPRAEIVARLAWHAWERGERPAPDLLVPNYLRASEAERKRRPAGDGTGS